MCLVDEEAELRSDLTFWVDKYLLSNEPFSKSSAQAGGCI